MAAAPLTLSEPSKLSMMKFLQQRASKGDMEATTILQECVEDLDTPAGAEETKEPQMVDMDTDEDRERLA
eukprot:5756727-Amphidinium_carterae.1